jgi:HEAT repeat protein
VHALAAAATRLGAVLGAGFALASLAPAARADSDLAALLEGRALERARNPVPVNYLLNEGRGKLAPEVEATARAQLTTALRVQTSPMVAMIAGARGSMDAPTMRRVQERAAKQASGTAIVTSGVAGMLNLPTFSQPAPPSAQEIAQAQREMRQGLADPWIRGIEAAEAYVVLGDVQAAARFYASCVGMPLGIDWLVDSCLAAILRLGPARAFALLDWMVKHPEQAAPGAGLGSLAGRASTDGVLDPASVQVRSAGLEGLGRLVGGGALGAQQREQAMQALLGHAEGKQNEPYLAGAAAGLGASRDPRALEPLRKLSQRWGNDATVREAAARGLVVGFRDEAAVAQLRKLLDDDDVERRFRAAALLFEVGDPAAFEWAVGVVTDRRAAEDTSPDIRGRVARDLLEKGGQAGVQALETIHRRGAGNDWLQAWVAVTLLESGNEAYLAEVRAALGKTDWRLDRPGLKAWWGRVSPFLQIALQAALTGTVDVQQVAQVIGNLVASERGRYSQQASLEEMLLAQVRWQAADAFAASGLDETVPDLVALLADERAVVRLSAARALAVHGGARAIDGYAAALATDFGEEDGIARAPEVRGAVLRSALIRHPKDPRTVELCRVAAGDADPGVRFMGLAELAARSH